MTSLLRRLFPLLLISLFIVQFPAYTQEDRCPALVLSALEATDHACENTGRNQVCYGNVLLQAETQPGAPALNFEQRGDIADVTGLRRLILSPMNIETGAWGVALMRLQANLPETLPGQNVTFLLFGDVDITNTVSFGDSAALNPMQTFYFRSGVGDAPCAEAPDSGILIQTPRGMGRVHLTVNEVNIQLGSTAYLQAQPDAALKIHVLEGQARVSAFDVDRVVTAGTHLNVPLDENLKASGPPGVSEPYPAEKSSVLTILLRLLPDKISPAVPPAEEVINAFNTCLLTARENVNVRGGPASIYPVSGRLPAGTSIPPDGQAQGIDGATWWHLPDGGWVRADVVRTAESCAALPVIVDLPATSPPSAGSVVGHITLHPWGCEPTEVPAGTITLTFGVGRWPTREEARAHIGDAGMAVLAVDGQPPVNYRRTGYSIHTGYGPSGWGDTTEAEITLSPGVYTYSGEWIDGPRACTITVK